MWHVCEEAHGSCGDGTVTVDRGAKNWQNELLKYAERLCVRYRTDQEQINHWYKVTKALWPVYREYWDEVNPDTTQRTPLLREQVFDVEYKLPSGRSVRLRGKWDGVDLVEGSEGKWIELDENKTKSQIDSDKINRQLTFDLQTMTYLIALRAWDDDNINQGVFAGEAAGVGFWVGHDAKIRGVRYNVIRRSAHKSVESMMKKITEDYQNGRIGEWFARWDVPVHQTDYDVFKTQCLNPILENLLDDYEWWVWCKDTGRDPFSYDLMKTNKKEYDLQKGDRYLRLPIARHYRLPYGVYSPVAEGGFGDLDEFMRTGSEVGLERVSSLFPELEGL
jgi:hypothetical protein